MKSKPNALILGLCLGLQFIYGRAMSHPKECVFFTTNWKGHPQKGSASLLGQDPQQMQGSDWVEHSQEHIQLQVVEVTWWKVSEEFQRTTRTPCISSKQFTMEKRILCLARQFGGAH